MKKPILLLLLVAGAGYAYWPYHQTDRYREALNSGSASELERLVDWPALRANLRDQFLNGAEKLLNERYGDKWHAVLKRSDLIAILEQGLTEMTAPNLIAQINKAKEKNPGNREITIAYRTFHSLSEFSVRFAGDVSASKFKLTGTDGWKLVGIEFGEKFIQEKLSSAMQAGGQRRVAPMAPAQSALQATPPPRSMAPAVPPGYISPLDRRPATERRAPQTPHPFR